MDTFTTRNPFSWRIGLHNTTNPCTLETLQPHGYDFSTTPITSAAFHSRVLALLSSHLSQSAQSPTNSPTPLPTISPLSAADALLRPSPRLSSLVALASPWIDLSSADPLIASLSRQVLVLEAGHAAFCGVGTLLVPGPEPGLEVGAGAGGEEEAGGGGGGVGRVPRLLAYARCLRDVLGGAVCMQVLVRLPAGAVGGVSALEQIGSLAPFARPQFGGGKRASVMLDDVGGGGAGEVDAMDVWDSWNFVRDVCGYHARLGIAIHLSQRAPSLDMQDQWFAEPIRVISLGGPDFIPNPKDFPVLDRFVRDYLYRLMRLIPRPSILLSDIQEPLPPPSDGLQSAKIPSNGTLLSLGAFDSSDTSNSTDPQRVSQDPTPAEAAALPSQRKQQAFHPTPYLSYVRWAERNQPDLPLISMFGTGYQDYLQTPLQPLTDNLESVTYEVFEKDPIKYSWYEKAITLALLDWQAMERPGSGPSGSITIAVVGAGRGPLVTRALRASQAAGVSVDLWALEKNPNAFLLLQSQNGASYDLQAEPPGWAGRVHLVQADMRSWQGPEYIGDSGRPSDPEFFNDEGSLPMRQSRIDILVSELLGSFGDNELSPECLDGVRHLMGPQSISIPSEYSAHISPLTTPKLHADLLGKSGSGLPDAMMTPYVVMLHACFSPSTTQYQQIWSFEHKFWTEVDDDQAQPSLNAQQPAQGYLANRHNTRASVRRFPCPTRGVIHGIAGYFEAVLYGDVELSTRPDTIEQKSRDMTSWFPIFFPIKAPLYFPDSSELQISMWRNTDGRKVWYEWLIESFLVLQSSKSMERGKRIRLGHSGLHSNIASAMVI